MVLRPLDRAQPLEDFAASSLASLRRERADLLLEARELVRLGKADAYRFTFVFADRGERLRGRQICAVNGNLGVLVTSLVREADAAVSELDEMIRTIQLVP